MKNTSVFLLLIILCYSGISSAHDIKIIFHLDISGLPPADSVGVFGTHFPLSIYKPVFLKKTGNNIFEVSLVFSDSILGTNLLYEYRSNQLGWEGARHRIVFTDNAEQTINDKWGYLDGPVAKVKSSLRIPVFEADSPQEKKALNEPFKGISTNGTPIPDLFPIKATGISTQPVQTAAMSFLNSLNDIQRNKCTFPIESNEWRRWHNIDSYGRTGIGLEELTPAQQEAAFTLLSVSLSSQGITKTKNIMAMEDYLAELTKDFNSRNTIGGKKYWFTFMGQPSQTNPWGWQLDGHHLVINYFVLGDQIVMTPVFMGSEPTAIKEGPNTGLRTFEAEETKGLAFYTSLSTEQKSKARIWKILDNDFNQGEAFHDNNIIPYAGISAGEFTAPQKAAFLELISEYISNIRGHSKIRMNEIKEHLNKTWFAWVQGDDKDGPFYYRIHSPVVLIEFDHQLPVFLWDHSVPKPGPVKSHIHTVVRTPNGNDYGKDLLAEHLRKYNKKN